MKDKNICPKCNGTNIIKVKGKAGACGFGNSIQVGWTIFSDILIHRYICCSCGYSEEWVDKEDIPALEKKYK